MMRSAVGLEEILAGCPAAKKNLHAGVLRLVNNMHVRWTKDSALTKKLRCGKSREKVDSVTQIFSSRKARAEEAELRLGKNCRL